jgi:hypothetical protein
MHHEKYVHGTSEAVDKRMTSSPSVLISAVNVRVAVHVHRSQHFNGLHPKLLSSNCPPPGWIDASCHRKASTNGSTSRLHATRPLETSPRFPRSPAKRDGLRPGLTITEWDARARRTIRRIANMSEAGLLRRVNRRGYSIGLDHLDFVRPLSRSCID